MIIAVKKVAMIVEEVMTAAENMDMNVDGDKTMLLFAAR